MIVFKKPILLIVVLLTSSLNAKGTINDINYVVTIEDMLKDLHLPPDYQIPQEIDVPVVQNSNDTNSDNQYDFGDAVDSRREVILENSNNKRQTQSFENNEPVPSAKSILSQQVWQPISLDDLIKKMEQQSRSLEYIRKLESRREAITNELDSFSMTWSVFGTDRLEKQEYFIRAMQYNGIPNLLHIIQHGNVAEACQAFIDLKNMWPWEHEHSFLIDTYTPEEKEFIDLIGVDVLKAAEMCLYSRADFLRQIRDQDDIRMLELRVSEFHHLYEYGKIERLILYKDQIEDALLRCNYDGQLNRGQLAILHSILHSLKPEMSKQAEVHSQLEEQIEAAPITSQVTPNNSADQVAQKPVSMQATVPNLFEQQTDTLQPVARQFIENLGLAPLQAHEFGAEHQPFFQQSNELLNKIATAHQSGNMNDITAAGTTVLTRTAQELQINGHSDKAQKLLTVAETKSRVIYVHPIDGYDIEADFEANLKAIQFCYSVSRHAAQQILHNIKNPREFFSRQVEGIKGWAVISTEILNTLALLSCGDPDMNAPIRGHDIVLHAAEQKFDFAATGIKAVVDHISKMTQPEFERFLGHILGDAVVDTVGMKGLGKLKGIVKDAAMRKLSEIKGATQSASVAIREASVAEAAATSSANAEHTVGKMKMPLETPATSSGPGNPRTPLPVPNRMSIPDGLVSLRDADELIFHTIKWANGTETNITGKMVKHMLTPAHLSDGLELLGATNNERFMKIIDVLETVGNSNLLKELDNQIEAIINGHQLCIKAYVKNGVCIHINAFPGTTERKLGNIITYKG
ncbi:MAG: hypothetical protein M1114_01910 [Candidatus Dependentiae bacterium]|nr:hypothetical protein [Candidatus Dependentiae bacterium]